MKCSLFICKCISGFKNVYPAGQSSNGSLQHKTETSSMSNVKQKHNSKMTIRTICKILKTIKKRKRGRGEKH